MSLIAWDESLSVNVAEIDSQHRKLVAMINELHDAMKSGKGKDVLGRILSGLISYTDTHFKAEEKYFAQFKYPDTTAHVKEHAAFVKKVTEFQIDFEGGRLTVSIDTLYFLRDWLQGHIKGTDKKYSAFFNENGLR
ncbi:bacteriohemerythrin [Candidatus Electronema sp. JM]|uniref:bacteriohemerythrin n=1 Tax=Candidatus Electronema sp. JM TaxID=3401571 RepID=UPI003AA94197